MTTTELRLPRDLHLALEAHLTQAQESAGYLLCGVIEDQDRLTFLGREWWPVRPRYRLLRSHGMSWHPNFDVAMLNRAQNEKLACVLVHHHRGSPPRLSPTDRVTCESLLPFLSGEAPGRAHAFVVMGDRAAAGRVYRDGREAGSLDEMVVVGSAIDRWPSAAEGAGRRTESRVGVVTNCGGNFLTAQLARSVREAACATALVEDFPSLKALQSLRRCDVIVACVDRVQARDELNRFCKRYLIPLIDLGLQAVLGGNRDRAPTSITGRISKSQPDGPCLRCQGLVDDARLLRERQEKWPGRLENERVPDPALITLNAVAASIAATEVLQILTGFAGSRSPNCGWIYDGITGTVERVEKRFRGCPACIRERGAGDLAVRPGLPGLAELGDRRPLALRVAVDEMPRDEHRRAALGALPAG
jgi:molybdopterin/thiamine biosynthesis adenylyltransferase/proteasome lid subunit RPN8/RPN11